MRSTIRPLAAVVMATGILLAACGSDDGGGSADTTAAEGTAADGGGAVDCQPIKAGVLTVVTSLPGPNFWGTQAAEVDPDTIESGIEYDLANDDRRGLRAEDGVPQRGLRRHRRRPGRRGLATTSCCRR